MFFPPVICGLPRPRITSWGAPGKATAYSTRVVYTSAWPGLARPPAPKTVKPSMSLRGPIPSPPTLKPVWLSGLVWRMERIWSESGAALARQKAIGWLKPGDVTASGPKPASDWAEPGRLPLMEQIALMVPMGSSMALAVAEGRPRLLLETAPAAARAGGQAPGARAGAQAVA